MRGTIKALTVAGVTLAAALGAVAAADAAIVTSQASLVNGQLTIVGSGAVPGSNVSVDDGPTTGQADAQGNFSISASGFSEPSCVATLYDGSVSVEVTLSGCTPTISLPPAVPGAPTPLGPAPGTSTTEPVALSWQPPAGMPGVSFQWQVSTDPSFTSLVLTATVSPKVTSATLSGLAPGTYYWRVQSVSFPPEPYFPLFGNWAPTSSLTITGEAPGTPGTPILQSPAQGSKFHPEETFPVNWSMAQGAASYRLQMSSSPTFAPGTLLADVPEKTTEAHAPLFGFQTPLFIRVFGVTANGILGLPSPTLALKITFHAPVPPPPKLLTPGAGATVTLPVVISWTPDPNPQTEGYQVEISTTPNFSGGCGGVEECITGLSQPRDTLHSLPAGIHYWRVRSFHGLAGPSRGAATAWSAARSFTVSGAPPKVRTLTIDVFTEGGVVLRSHTHAFSGTNEDNEAFGIVQLTTPAPSGGQVITLTSSNPKVAAIPASVTIPAGQAQKTFRIRPLQVRKPTKVTLSATPHGQATPVTAPLTVDPADLKQIDINAGPPTPNIFSGGTPQVGTVMFNGNAPVGSVVALASNSPDASVPASVTVPAGLPANFTITTQQVTTSTPVTITATWRGMTISEKMTLQPPPALLAPASAVSFAVGHVVIFRWHTASGLSSQLQVADNPAFSNPAVSLDTNTAQAWAVMSLPSGKLYWRVLGVDAYGVDGPSPAVRTFTVKPPAGPLPAPVPEFPANGATVTQGQQVAFFWQPVTGAASYELQVASSSAFTAPLVLDRKVKNNQVNTSKLPAGTLFWRVRAMDSLGNPGAWSVTFQLTVAPG
jgi:hypothetical protein